MLDEQKRIQICTCAKVYTMYKLSTPLNESWEEPRKSSAQESRLWAILHFWILDTTQFIQGIETILSPPLSCECCQNPEVLVPWTRKPGLS